MIWVEFCVIFVIHINFSYLLQFCIQFLYTFSSSSNKFNIENSVFFLCRKNQFLSQTKNLCLSLRKSSVRRPIFQNLRETKKQKRNKHLKKTLEKWFSVYMNISVVQKKPSMHSNCIWYTAKFEPWLGGRNHIASNNRLNDHWEQYHIGTCNMYWYVI